MTHDQWILTAVICCSVFGVGTSLYAFIYGVTKMIKFFEAEYRRWEQEQ